MHRLTREVRFFINPADDTPADGQQPKGPSNGHGGYPSLRWHPHGLAHYLTLQATVVGELDPDSRYLINIKEIDSAVRRLAIPALERTIRAGGFGGGGRVMLELFERLSGAWPTVRLEALQLSLSPFLHLSIQAAEVPMVRLSQRFEFSASHRLHNPLLTDEQNRQIYGKCNNPHGHGHNYELQVTVRGTPDAGGVVIDVPALERIVVRTVIDRLDHRNLNVEVPEFRGQIPSVENIAATIYRMLKPALKSERADLASVTVWETPKTWCEYSE